MNRQEAYNLLRTYVSSESLLKHSFAVEASMCGYAKIFGEDVERWGMCGLLHDIDFEQFPDEHPLKGVMWLTELGFDDEFVQAIKGHSNATQTPRTTRLAKTLYAVDELSGFVVAVALVRPERLENLGAKSVRKKMKDKAFARAVDREEIISGAEDLEIALDEHIENVITALQVRDAELKDLGVTLL